MNVVKDDNKDDRPSEHLRDTARTIGPLVAVVWLVSGIGYAVLDPWTLTSALAVVFLCCLALSTGIAWWKEGIGGIMLVVFSVVFSIFACIAASHNRALALLLSGGPFLLVGVLFIAASQRAKRTSLHDGSSTVTPDDINAQGSV